MRTPVYVGFQGGGVLGMAHLGAWQVLSHRFDIKGVSGTSAGSIVASLCASRYSPADAINLFRDLDWGQFVKNQSVLGRMFSGVVAAARKQQGLNDGETFRKWMLAQLAARFPDLEPHEVTFAELYQKTGIHLAVIACNLNNKDATPHVFDWENEPKAIVAQAVRASIAIPGLFTPVPSSLFGQELIDGGLLLNFPVDLLYPYAQQTGCPLVGIRFKHQLDHLENPTITQVLGRSLELVLRRGSLPSDRVLNDPNYIDVEIDDTGFSSTNFDLSEAQKNELIRRGVAAAEKALEAYDHRMAPSPVLLSRSSPQMPKAVPSNERSADQTMTRSVDPRTPKIQQEFASIYRQITILQRAIRHAEEQYRVTQDPTLLVRIDDLKDQIAELEERRL